MTAPTDDPAVAAADESSDAAGRAGVGRAGSAGSADGGAGVAAVLEARVPGVELLGALSTDPAVTVGEVAEAGMRAGFALECHATWLRCRWLLEACRARAGTTARVLDDPYAAQIAAAALASSSTMAAMRLELAEGVLERLPALGEEMAAGRLEEGKAWHFVSVLRDLDQATAREVVDQLLGRARKSPHQKLRDLIEAKAGELDPAWDEVRKAAAVARARVLARLRNSGAAEISGLDLPWEAAKEAYDHVVAIAAAVRKELIGRGITQSEGTVQAHVFLRLLGRGHLGSDDPDLVARLTHELAALPDPDDPDPDDGPDGPNLDGDPDPDPDPDDDGPGDGPGPDLDDLGGGLSDDGPSDDRSSDSSDVDGGPDLDDLDPDGDPELDLEFVPGPGELADAVAAGAGRRLAYRRRVAVRVGLATLLGLDTHPGQMPGWGTVPAPIARRLADRRHAATWRLLLYDMLGALEYILLVHPPGRSGNTAPDDPHRRQVVELTMHTADLEALDADDCLHPDLVAEARAELAAAREHPERHPATTTADAMQRHPRTALDTWIRGRDQCCRFPGCDRPAYAADLDHTLAVTDGGITLADNLGPLCRYHHRLKHTSAWTLTQPSPGTFVWTAPTGTVLVVEPDPQLPPPAPLNTDPNRHLALLYASGEYEPRPWTPRRDRRGRISAAARATAVEIEQHERRRRAAPPSPYDDEPPF